MNSKEELRKGILDIRNNMPEEEIMLNSEIIQQKVFDFAGYKKASAILLYHSKETEVQTLKIIQTALKEGKKVILPVTDTKTKALTLVRLDNINLLKPGAFGIMEPIFNPKTDASKIFELKNIDLAILPAVAVDFEGNKLGYGMGYFDRLFSSFDCKFNCKSKISLKKIALIFDNQFIESIPAEKHDVKLDGIITEKRILQWRTKK